MALLIDNSIAAQLLTMRECLDALEFVLMEKGLGLELPSEWFLQDIRT